MIKGTAKLVVDLGNSETRVLTMFGKNKSGTMKRRITATSNRYAEHNPDLALNDSINATNSVIFHATGEVAGKELDRDFVGGLLVDREYDSKALRPAALEKKHTTVSTLLALHRAFLEGYRAIASIEGVGLDAIEVDWEVSVLMPPADITPESSVAMANVIRSIKKIKFMMPEVEHDINILPGKITVSAEGMGAFFGVYLDKTGGVRSGYEYMSDNSVLVLDVGAGTSDFLVIDKGQAIESTKFTTNKGGNDVAATLRNILKRKGYSVTNIEAREGVVRGEIRDGASVVDIRDSVAQAKSDVASILIGEFQDFFESSGIEPRSLNYLLVVGGGAITPDVEGIEPISKYLIDQMISYSPKIGLVENPVEEVKRNGELIQQPLNPRLLNILGAGVFASLS